MTVRLDKLQSKDITKWFELLFHYLDQNLTSMIELLYDITEVLDQIWYKRNQFRFYGKQANPC